MKVLVVFALIAVANAGYIKPEPFSAYGYIQRVAIPLAEKIFEAELKAASDPSTKIIGGSLATLGQFPYQAGLIAGFEGMTGRGVCGASLVSPQTLLTAAHCWFDGQNQANILEVVLGSVTLFTGGTRINTNDVFMHPSWNPLLVRNDIAVIYLPSSVTFSNNIAPISLPSGAELNSNYVGQSAVASGFGLTTNDGAIEATQGLSFVELSVITNTVCRLAFPINLHNSNICTSGIGGISTCRGDSGGPLVVTQNNRSFLIGITSFGSGLGCEAGMPAAFVRVTSFIDFINANLK